MNKLFIFLTIIFFSTLLNAQDSSKVFSDGSIIINTKVLSRECFVAKSKKVYTLYKLEVINVLRSNENIISDTINAIVFGGSTEYVINNGPFDWSFLKIDEQYVVSLNKDNLEPILNTLNNDNYFRLTGENINIQNSSTFYTTVKGEKYADSDSFVKFLNNNEQLSVTEFDTKVEFKVIAPILTEEEKRIKLEELRNSSDLNKKN